MTCLVAEIVNDLTHYLLKLLEEKHSTQVVQTFWEYAEDLLVCLESAIRHQQTNGNLGDAHQVREMKKQINQVLMEFTLFNALKR